MAYKAYETPEELAEQRKQAEKSKRQFVYRRPVLTPNQIAQYQSENRPHVVRFAMPVKDYRFTDAVLGANQGVGADQVQDFVIRKSDGMPTYHFAVVVDDAEMGITHVLRGQEHLLNTVNHIALQDALGYARPIYAHLPVILNTTDGSKMGKRDRDKAIRQRAHLYLRSAKTDADGLATAAGLLPEVITGWLKNEKSQLNSAQQSAVMKVIGLKPSDLPEILVHDFRKNGYLPEALLNFLALLGWSPGHDKERMTTQEMTDLFSLEGIGQSNAKFDRNKLLAFNTEACAAATPKRLLQAFKDFLKVNPESPLNQATDTDLAKLLEMKKGFRTLLEVEETSRFFFIPDDQVEYNPADVEKVLKKNDNQGFTALKDLRSLLANLPTWTAPLIEQTVKTYADQKQLALGKVAQPLRVAISGTTISPPIFESLEFLTQTHTLARIDQRLRPSS